MDFNPYLLAKVQFLSSSENALALDHNPGLQPWKAPAPNNVAGKGQIEEPGQAKNIVWQTRAAAPTAYENALGDALEAVFGAGALTLDEVVAGLNANGFRRPDGSPWTAPAFEAEMARLGA
ncbi:recombinase-like helix-turn-helix domain-containing protein [Aquabacterium sp.]|uniref:recombinase-like helix-turn-helix domain-containing protein n=1 Tax=Aquabacterium sp. TaxID=1872578 RepID=UPI0037850A1C